MKESKRAKVGFVILIWNSEKVIENCLRSIAGLKTIDPAVVLIDNGSTDRGAEIVNRYAEQYPGLFSCVRYGENRGTTVSRNDGLRRLRDASPDYYCILDSDTVVNDDAFLTMIGEMETHPEYGLIGPTMANSDGILQMSARAFPTLTDKALKVIPLEALQEKGVRMERQVPPDPDARSYPVDYLMSACWLIRPETLEKAGLLDEKIFYAPEDAEYCIRVWKAGYQVAFCPAARIVHEWQRLSRKKVVSKMNWEHIKGLAYMFRKHRYLFSTKRLKRAFSTAP